MGRKRDHWEEHKSTSSDVHGAELDAGCSLMNDPSWHHLQQKDQPASCSLPEFLTHRIVSRVNGCRFNQLSFNVVYCAAVGNYNRLLQCSVISGLNRNHHLDDDSYPFRYYRNETISSLSEEQWRENSETMTQGVCLFKGNSFSIWFPGLSVIKETLALLLEQLIWLS